MRNMNNQCDAAMSVETPLTAVERPATHSLSGVCGFALSDAEMDLLTEALKHHSDGYTRADITVQLCWDADRLKLGPCGH